MTMLGKNYRKAKKGDIKCSDCEFSHRPKFSGQRFRCGCRYIYSYAVGKNMTCDAAHKASDGQRSSP